MRIQVREGGGCPLLAPGGSLELWDWEHCIWRQSWLEEEEEEEEASGLKASLKHPSSPLVPNDLLFSLGSPLPLSSPFF